MPAPLWIERLRQHWKVDNVWQVCIILIVFACTGFTIYFLKKPLLHFFAGKQEKTILSSIVYYILILPVYNVVLLCYGFIFGQFGFFWAFEKRFLNRFLMIWKTKK